MGDYQLVTKISANIPAIITYLQCVFGYIFRIFSLGKDNEFLIKKATFVAFFITKRANGVGAKCNVNIPLLLYKGCRGVLVLPCRLM